MSEILAAVFEGAATAARVLERLREGSAPVAGRLAEACALRREQDGRLRLEEALHPPDRPAPAARLLAPPLGPPPHP